MSVKSKMLVLSAVAALVMSVVGCGGDAKKTDAPAGGTAEPAATGAPAADTGAPAATGAPAEAPK